MAAVAAGGRTGGFNLTITHRLRPPQLATMTETIVRAHARREEIASEVRQVATEIRSREREVGLEMVAEGRHAADPRLEELRARRSELLNELRVLSVGLEFARHPHHP